MQRNAEICAGLDQLAVPGTNRRRSGLRPFCETNLNGNAEALARLVERLVDTRAASVNDDEITPVLRDQALQDEHRQRVAGPRSFADHYDTHVQKVATMRKHRKTQEQAFDDRQILVAESALRHTGAIPANEVRRMVLGWVDALARLA